LSLCLASAGIVKTLALAAFTLAWTHSIEKIRWEEDYRIENGKLVLTMARIRGSGAGMEPPEGAVLRSGVYEYRPPGVVLDKLTLARSTYTKDYELCWSGRCRGFAELVGAPQGGTVDLFPCPTK